jgi:hypothetical protein
METVLLIRLFWLYFDWMIIRSKVKRSGAGRKISEEVDDFIFVVLFGTALYKFM